MVKEYGLSEREQLDRIIFTGQALTPFFLMDPKTGDAGPSFEAFAQMDPEAAARDWPFVETADAEDHLRMMSEAVANGVDDDLIWEYRRLFVGPGKKPAPPWGSVYMDHEQVVFGRTTLELREWMRAHGIEHHSDEREPEDHIGLMLALMAWIAHEQPEALDEYLSEHLLTWSSHFLDQLATVAKHPFYEGLALLAKDSLEGIGRTRALEIHTPRFFR